MRIALITEGSYPFSHGGVSTWCDQLVRGLPEHDFEVVALTATGTEKLQWDLPGNVGAVRSLPMWGEARRTVGRTGFARRFRPGRRHAVRPLVRGDLDPVARAGAHDLVHALIEPDLQLAGDRFRSALRTWARIAPDHDLEGALLSPELISVLMDAWPAEELAVNWGGCERGVPTVADAVTAARLLTHMLRPLEHRPPVADVVHLVSNGIAGLVGLAAKWRHGTPFVLSEHGVYLRERYLSFGRSTYARPVKWLLLRFYRLLSSAVYAEAALVAPGNVYNQRWETWDGVPDNVIRTVYNGVDPAEFTPADTEPEVPTIAWVGRIDPIKDLETLVRAFALVRQRCPQARLRVFGGTPAGNEDYRSALEQLATDLGLGDSACFEGRVESVQDAYAAGHLVALTSISEGFPYTVIEAMSCGRATVSTDVGGVAEAVGDAGLVVPPRDPAAFADACVQLLTDDAERRRLAARARDRVIELFTLEQSLTAFRTIYADVRSGVDREGALAGREVLV
ncbi:GT4 family glycosyltransferase PelF [Kineosporia succinea]|uniref:Glycosyltransferase involved in cell wall biosynthesis n=1 Tax=Kineosporia succinea TaxID=84632 RepID=A0ABT9PCV0_9ACTN|nr:GT4 family glycosyltransferase PelF [Kineosporia succinea]MDP9830523.1 glycosyltransferase involved in cell wall biosynthesis [Kineosporia succinea]